MQNLNANTKANKQEVANINFYTQVYPQETEHSMPNAEVEFETKQGMENLEDQEKGSRNIMNQGK